MINEDFYLVDLPGYGFARGSHSQRDKIAHIIEWYFTSALIKNYKTVLIIDAKVGPTADDINMYKFLQDQSKDIIIIANKFDKLKQSEQFKNMKVIEEAFPGRTIIKYSAIEKLGVEELFEAINIKEVTTDLVDDTETE